MIFFNALTQSLQVRIIFIIFTVKKPQKIIQIRTSEIQI